MIATAVSRARDFVAAAPLPMVHPASRGAADATPQPALTGGKPQATVVGSEVLSFAPGVDSPWRQDLVNGSLLAQLVAKKKVPDPNRIFDWYDAYFDTLGRIGWAVQDKSFAVYVESSQNFQAHEAILKVAAGLLGPNAAGLALLSTTLDALKSMDASSPWITVFNRESQSASAAKFQLSVADQAPNGDLKVQLMAFGLEARTQLTQVLFFKGLASQATLRHCSASVGIDTSVVEGVRDALKAKLVGQANEFVKTLPDF